MVFALFLIEFPALLNVFDYRSVIGPLHRWWAPNVTDPELLHVHRPYARQSGEIRGGLASWGFQIPASDMTMYRWNVRYDHNGFRNEVDLQSADIAVIGDSFVEALTVSNEELMTSLLAHLQGKVVANLGQSAYGPQQELVVLKRYGLALRPRTVIWMFFEGNDLEDVITYRNATRNAPSFWREFYARSFTRNALKEVKGFFFATPKPAGVKRSAELQVSNGHQLTMYFVYPPPGFTKENLSAFDETIGVIAKAHDLCAALGARMILVFVPTKFRVFHFFCQFPQESECRNWVVNDLPERLRTAVSAISPEIGYLDLTPSLVDGVRRGMIPYYPDDEHWSPEGHKIAAEAINEHLLAARNR